MNLSLISNDSELHKSFEQTGYFNVLIKTAIQEVDDSDVIVVSDNELSHNDLSLSFETDTKNSLKNKHIFFMLSNFYSEQMINNIISISKTRNINIIPPKLTISQIVERVIEKVFPKSSVKNSNIITFFGADSKVGTTMIAQSVAEVLAKNTEVKVGLFFLNGSPSTYYMKKRDKVGLDDIKIKLINNILTADELIESCSQENENLYILPGADYLLDVRHYHPEYVDRLIKLGSEKFNVIIIDAGYNIDSGMAIAALNATKIKYLVTTQQDVIRKNYERVEGQIFNRLQIKPGDFMLVVNKFLNSNHIYTAKQIADIYKMTLASYIPHLEFLGWQAEFDHKTLLHYSNDSYNKQIELLSKLISAQVKISYRNQSLKKEGFIRKALNTLGGVL